MHTTTVSGEEQKAHAIIQGKKNRDNIAIPFKKFEKLHIFHFKSRCLSLKKQKFLKEGYAVTYFQLSSKVVPLFSHRILFNFSLV